MKKTLAAVAATVVVLAGGALVMAPSASAATCRESSFSSSMFSKKFNCSDGSSMTVRPNISGSYDDPFSRYSGRDNYGNSYSCKYSSFSSRYSCTSTGW
jgi:hypothetical protein